MSNRIESLDHKRRAAWGENGKGGFYVIVSERKAGFSTGNTPVTESDTWEDRPVLSLAAGERIACRWIAGAPLTEVMAAADAYDPQGE